MDDLKAVPFKEFGFLSQPLKSCPDTKHQSGDSGESSRTPHGCALSKNISRKGPRGTADRSAAGPTASRGRRDDKGKGDGSIGGCWTEASFITLGGPQAHGYSGSIGKPG